MHFVSEVRDLIADFINFLACGMQLHGDDHGGPRFFLPSFFLPSSCRFLPFFCGDNLTGRKTKTHSPCEWVGIFPLLL